MKCEPKGNDALSGGSRRCFIDDTIYLIESSFILLHVHCWRTREESTSRRNDLPQCHFSHPQENITCHTCRSAKTSCWLHSGYRTRDLNQILVIGYRNIISRRREGEISNRRRNGDKVESNG